MTEIYAIKIDETIEDIEYKELQLCVAEEKRARIKRYHFIEDAKRTLYGDLMIRHLICEKLELPNREIIFYTNKFGKPFLNGFPNFCFNISHSGNWVACAISEKKIGIDVEQIKPIDMDIAKQFFSPKEYQSLIRQPSELRLNYFYDLWTLKESYIKFVGQGLSIPLKSFSINIGNGIIEIFPEHLPKINFMQLSLAYMYKLSVCTEDHDLSAKVQIITIDTICKSIIN